MALSQHTGEGEGGPDIVAVEQEKDLGVIISSDLKTEKMVSKQVQKAHVKLSQFNSTFTYRGETWLKLYKTYVKPCLMYACEAWRPGTKEGIEKLEAVQKRAVRMAGGQGEKSCREACREVGLNTLEEELDEADMDHEWKQQGEQGVLLDAGGSQAWGRKEEIQRERNKENYSCIT